MAPLLYIYVDEEPGILGIIQYPTAVVSMDTDEGFGELYFHVILYEGWYAHFKLEDNLLSFLIEKESRTIFCILYWK